MKEESSNPLWKFFGGAAVGAVLTCAYVRFGYSLPGIVQIPQKVQSEAIVTTAEIDLYDLEASREVRQRAAAVVLGQRPELFIELDNAHGNAILEELLRRKAVRKAKLLKQRFSGYDMALDKPALAKLYRQKHGTDDREQLERRMLLEDINRDEYLRLYLAERFPDVERDGIVDLVLDVYRNELRAAKVAADNTERL